MAETVTVNATANDRFKQRFGGWFWGSVIVATAFHAALFAFFPNLHAADSSFQPNVSEAVNMPPEVEIPPPPKQIARPATPVVGDAKIDEDITIASTSFADNPIESLPAPPTAGESKDISAAPVFTPMTVRPTLLNRAEVGRVLERSYPPLLRDSGIGGSPEVWFFIDENGKVLKTQLKKSSGYDQLDKAAMDVAGIMKFSPAQNRDKMVKVWINLPITFTAK